MPDRAARWCRERPSPGKRIGHGVVDELSFGLPFGVRRAGEDRVDLGGPAPLMSAHRPELSDLATVDGHDDGLARLGLAYEIAGVLAQFAKSCGRHDATIALVLPERRSEEPAGLRSRACRRLSGQMVWSFNQSAATDDE